MKHKVFCKLVLPAVALCCYCLSLTTPVFSQLAMGFQENSAMSNSSLPLDIALRPGATAPTNKIEALNSGLNASAGGTAGIVSDDFCHGTLNTSIWTFTDPQAGSSPTALQFTRNMLEDAWLEFDVPGGVEHQMFNTINAAYISQPANDVDFAVEVKMESGLSQQFQEQGIIVIGSGGQFLRFEIFSNGFTNSMYATGYPGGASARIITLPIANGTAPLWMRLQREGNLWTQSFSANGVNFNISQTYTYAITVTEIGLYGGNAPSGLSPAHRARFDYFENLDASTQITDEDGCCYISNVSAPAVASCNGDDATFNVSFDVDNGSGSYEVIDVSNGNSVLSSVTGFAASGTGFNIPVYINGPTATGTIDIDIKDALDGACFGGIPQTVSIPVCTVSNDCNLITNGLVLHLESDFGITEVAGLVSLWADQSGAGNDLTGSGDPQLLTSFGPNGQDFIALDGNGDKLDQLLCLSALQVANSDRTVFLIARYNNSAVDAGFSYGNAADNRAFGLTVDGSSGSLTVQGYGATNDQVSGTTGTGASWLSQSVVLNANTFTHYLNGSLIDTGAHLFDTGGDQIVIGETIGGGGFAEMDVAAVLVYDRALAEAERLYVESYLQEKYFGQSCDQACAVFNVAAPASANCNGDDAEFTVTFDVLDGSGEYAVVNANTDDVLASITVPAGSATGLGIDVLLSGPTTAASIDIEVMDVNSGGSCAGSNPVTVSIPDCPFTTCTIREVFVGEMAICDDNDARFTVFFDVENGSGTYQVVDLDNANQVLGTITDAAASCNGQAIEVVLTAPIVAANLNITVVDAAHPINCIGSNTRAVSIPACPLVNACSLLNNVSAPVKAICNGNNAEFTVTFDVTDGSGDYQVVDVQNGNQVLGSISGAAASGTGLSIAISTTNTGSLLVDVVDANLSNCMSGHPQLINIPSCPIPESCEISEVDVAGDALCFGNDAQFNVTFDATNGSGNYEVFNTDNPTEVLGLITGAPSTCDDIEIAVSLTGPRLQNTLSIDVRDTDLPGCAGGIPQTVIFPTCPAANSVQVAVKVMLQGPFDSTSGLMKDDLRTGNYLPHTDPYGLNVNLKPELLEDRADPADNVVDWVKIELRKEDGSGEPTVIVGTAVGLVKRNGEVITPDGSDHIFFYDNFACDYYLAVFHRNHLAIMTDSSISISGAGSE